MSRIVLVHWNALENEERAGRLRSAGYDVIGHADARANPRVLATNPPDAFVIDLTRLPSQGRELGGFLRRLPATRRIPLVFLEGDPAKTSGVRALLPDAIYTTWDRVAEDIEKALAAPPSQPVVPGAMDAYAGVPLAQKLGIKASSTLLLLNAPAGFEQTLGTLPDSVRLACRTSRPVDLVLWFVAQAEDLEARFAATADSVRPGGRLWILWRKRRGGVAGSLTQTEIRAAALRKGWVDYKVSAVDETWAGLCFARRAAGSGSARPA